ncbi:MAG: DUF3267 domain-containing protein [Chloroflexus sp.]
MTQHDESTWQRLDRSVGFNDANLSGTLFGLVPALIVVASHIWLHGTPGLLDSLASLWWWLTVIGGIVVHEGLHALGWMIAGRLSLKAIAFSIDRQTFSPYTHSRQPIAINAYRFGIVLPVLSLGVVPALIGIAINLPAFTIFGALFILVAGGDLLILWLIRNDPSYALAIDHPSRVGCEVLLPVAERTPRANPTD